VLSSKRIMEKMLQTMAGGAYMRIIPRRKREEIEVDPSIAWYVTISCASTIKLYILKVNFSYAERVKRSKTETEPTQLDC
jgi:hypothetical protein